jgi:quinohemoprotein ethanol dehydrogenase
MNIAYWTGLAFAAFAAFAAALGGSMGNAWAQAKGSPEHIRAAIGRVDGNAIRTNAKSTRDWPSYGLDYAETRFSRLKEINAGNVGKLGLAWSYNLESTRGVEATPLVVDGIMVGLIAVVIIVFSSIITRWVQGSMF